MTWRAANFRDYYVRAGGQENSAASYCSNLRKLDDFTNGLDEKIAIMGFDGIIAWAKDQVDGPFADYPSNIRSALKKYVTFLVDSADPETPLDDTVPNQDTIEAEATLFRYERELQAATRRQIGTLEPGLKVADGGTERAVATGRIDILGESASGQLVVLELKAGSCPAGALEQALGYTHDLETETGQECRTILVAGDFPERIRAASRRVNGLRLVTYKLSLAFEEDR